MIIGNLFQKWTFYAVCFVTVLSGVPAFAQQYYVSPNGNDNWPGTSSEPWQTINKVNSFTFSAGDTVSFRGGATFTGCLLFNGTNVMNSSASSPFTVNSYGGGVATIQSTCTGDYSAAVTVDNVSGFYLNGLKLVNGGTTAAGVLLENQSSSSATQTMVVENSEITGFSTPTGSSTIFGGEIEILGDAVNGNNGPMNNIQILNNVLHGATVTSADSAGVGGYGYGENISNVLVQGNTVYNLGMPASDTGAGILAGGWNGATIQYNLIHDIGANTTSCGGPSGIESYASNNVTVRFNEVYNVQPVPSYSAGCDWDGIDLDGGTTNSVVEYNYTHHNAGAGLLAYDNNPSGYTWGPNTYRYNISENDDWDENGGAIFGVVPNPPQNALAIYGNSLFDNNTTETSKTQASACFQFGYSAGAWGGGSFIDDNICYMNNLDEYGRNGSFYYNPFLQTMPLANNLYWTDNGRPSWVWGQNNYTSSDQWQATGLESAFVYADPLFSNPGGGGTCNWTPSQGNGPQSCPSAYQLQANSAAIGAGKTVSNNGSRDYFNNSLTNPPSIGAYSTGSANGTGNGNSAPPPAPTASASAASVSTINVTWTASPGAWSYSVYRSTTSGFTPSTSNLIAEGVQGSPFPDTGLTHSTTYYYVVEAVNGAGSSGASNQASATTPGQTMFYVSPSGNDSNNGTSTATAWQTVNKVNTFAFPEGSVVAFQGGSTFTGCIVANATNVPQSSAPNPFTLTSYGSGMATIQSNCTGSLSAAITGDNVSGFTVNGLKLVNGSQTAAGVLLENQAVSWATQTMVIENSDISGFGTSQGGGGEILLIGDAANGNNGPLNDVEILNNVLHGAFVTSSDSAGIGGYGYGENISNVVIRGNSIFNIGMPASDTAAGVLANGWNGAIIEHNVIHDIGANTTSCGGPSGIESYTSNNVTVRYNEVYNVQPSSAPTNGCDWDAIDLDGGTTNSIVEYNYTHHNAGAGIYAYASTPNGDTWGPNTYRYNISENDDWAKGISGLFAVGYGPVPNPIYVYGNTLFDNNNQSAASTDPSACMFFGMWNAGGAFASGSMIKDNICYMNNPNSSQNVEFVRTAGDAISGSLPFASNLYYSPTSNHPEWIWDGSTYTSLANWENSGGQESNSLWGDPLFTAPGNGGTCSWTPSSLNGPAPCPQAYTLQAGSPASAAGAPVSSNGGADYYGNPIPSTPSIGAQATVSSGNISACHTGTWCAQANLPASPSYGSLFELGTWPANQSNWIASFWIRGSGSIQLQALNNSTVLAQTECTATSAWTKCSTPVFNTGSAGVNRFNIIGYYGGPATLYIDDTFLGPSGGSNQLPNPGFESGSSSWNIDGGGQGVYTIGQFTN